MPNNGRPRDLVHLPNAGMAPDLISAPSPAANTRASFCLIHAMLGNKVVHAHARYRRDGTRSTSRGRAKGVLSDGAMAGG